MAYSLRPALAGMTLMICAQGAQAQTYPSQSTTAVTDDAEILSTVQEAELATQLARIERDGDVDFAVVTLLSTALYTGGDDLDVYAQGLISAWEMGADTDGRAALILVFHDDAEMVIEYGPGFDSTATAPTQAIIDDTILPAFGDSDFALGLTEGVAQIAAQVISPVAIPSPPGTPTQGSSSILYWIGGGIAALIALVVGTNRRRAAKLAATPCPSCGAMGLTRTRITLTEATQTHDGSGEIRTACPSCGHIEAEAFTIAKRAADTKSDDTPGKGGSGSW